MQNRNIVLWLKNFLYNYVIYVLNIRNFWKYIKNYKTSPLRQKLPRQNWYAEAYSNIDDASIAVNVSKIHQQDTNEVLNIVLQLHDFSVGSRGDTGLT